MPASRSVVAGCWAGREEFLYTLEEFLYTLKAGPAGGRPRRPSSAGSDMSQEPRPVGGLFTHSGTSGTVL
jgi:hypothetical protein